MTKFAYVSCVAVGLVGFGIGSSVVASEKTGVDAKAAYARLKTLAGTWEIGKAEGDLCQMAGGKINYKVTANGSTVVETDFAGTEQEMVTMYHLDGDELRMTHYCAAGNQPRFKLDKEGSTPDRLSFVFDGGTNLDPSKDMHIHAGRIAFLEGGKIESEWDAYAGGKKAGSTKIPMTRPAKN